MLETQEADEAGSAQYNNAELASLLQEGLAPSSKHNESSWTHEEEGQHNVFKLVVGGLVALTHHQGEPHGDLGCFVDATQVSDVEPVIFVEAGTVTLGEAAWSPQLDPGTGLFNIVEVVFNVVVPQVKLTCKGGVELSCLMRGALGLLLLTSSSSSLPSSSAQSR